MENSKKKLLIDDERIKEIVSSENPHLVIEPLFNVNIYDGEEHYEKDLAPFTMSQRYIYAINWYDAEVNNGGHYQFFNNSTGIVWEDALKGFEAIGATKNYIILKEAIDRMGGRPSKDRIERQAQLNQFGYGYDDFDDLDDAYYEISLNLNKLLCVYIEENAKDFHFLGESEA